MALHSGSLSSLPQIPFGVALIEHRLVRREILFKLSSTDRSLEYFVGVVSVSRFTQGRIIVAVQEADRFGAARKHPKEVPPLSPFSKLVGE